MKHGACEPEPENPPAEQAVNVNVEVIEVVEIDRHETCPAPHPSPAASAAVSTDLVSPRPHNPAPGVMLYLDDSGRYISKATMNRIYKRGNMTAEEWEDLRAGFHSNKEIKK